MPEIELSAGTIEYSDTGGSGPCVVLLHGVLMNGSVWRNVVADLREDHRCVVPTLPLGGHRLPMRADADLSIDALALLVAELLERLDLDDVTLVMNDWGGPQLLVEKDRTERIGKLVLVACEAFDNFPPGKPGRQLAMLARIPGGFALQAQLVRSAAVRRSVASALAKHPIPDAVLRDWLTPLMTTPAVRRDLRKYCRSVPLGGGRDWSASLATFPGPALVVWAPEDRMMPREHGARLAALMPKGRLVEVDDTYTAVPEDQPEELAQHLRDFVR